MTDTDVTAVAVVSAVLVAVDGGPPGWDALAWAAADAAAGRQSLRIVHVVNWGTVSDGFIASVEGEWAANLYAAGEVVLQDAAQRARDVAPNLHVVTQLLADTRPGSAVLRAGTKDTLIVLGRPRCGRVFGRRFGRSVVSNVLRRAHCPVVVVQLAATAAGPSAGRVAVVDNAEPASALAFAMAAAARRGVGVTVFEAGCGNTASTIATASAGSALLVLAARRRRCLHRAIVSPGARSLVDSVAAPVVIVNNVDPSSWVLGDDRSTSHT
jgi:nucleotide-binding universal stress UspA family protein